MDDDVLLWCKRCHNKECTILPTPGRGTHQSVWFWDDVGPSSYINYVPKAVYGFLEAKEDPVFHNKAYLTKEEAVEDLMLAVIKYFSQFYSGPYYKEKE